MTKMKKERTKDLVEESEKQNVEIKNDKPLTFGQKASDYISDKVGSWGFIISFLVIILSWISLNAYVLIQKPFDPYPFILLNLVLSCVAALQAPIIMMSQNRQEAKDSLRIQNDYVVDQKAVELLKEMHKDIIELKKEQKIILEHLEKNQEPKE